MVLDPLKFEIQDETLMGTRIKVIGVGGGGSNAVARMLSAGLGGVEFYAINTDRQALKACPVPNKLVIGAKITNGLGVGSDPETGRQAALEDTESIIEILEGTDMVFVTAGLGGGTGTGAAPVVASLAKELNALTVAVVTKPFAFEGPRRAKVADKGLGELAGTVDTVIAIPNDRLLELVPPKMSFFESFRVADDVLFQAVQGISDIITTPGVINRDFSDIRSIMLGMGYAMMGTATASGENAAVEAARKAINCPLLDEGGVRGARGILINITGSSGLGLHEVNEACTLIRAAAENEDAQINFGVVLDESLGDEVKITVIATGFQRESLPEISRRPVTGRENRETASRLAPGHSEELRAAAAPVAPAHEPMVFEVPAPPEPEPEPMSPAAAAPHRAEELLSPDDVETPAFLRKRRMLQ